MFKIVWTKMNKTCLHMSSPCGSEPLAVKHGSTISFMYIHIHDKKLKILRMCCRNSGHSCTSLDPSLATGARCNSSNAASCHCPMPVQCHSSANVKWSNPLKLAYYDDVERQPCLKKCKKPNHTFFSWFVRCFKLVTCSAQDLPAAKSVRRFDPRANSASSQSSGPNSL